AVVLFLFTWSVMAFAVLSMDTIILLLATLSFYGFVRALAGDLWGGVILGLSLGAAVLCSFLALTLPLTWLILLWARRARVGAGAAARRWYDRPARWFTHLAAPIAVVQAIAVEIFLDTYW